MVPLHFRDKDFFSSGSSSSLHPHASIRSAESPSSPPRLRGARYAKVTASCRHPHATKSPGVNVSRPGQPRRGPCATKPRDSSNQVRTVASSIPSPPRILPIVASLTRTAIEHAIYASSVHVGSSQSPPLLLDQRPAHVVQMAQRRTRPHEAHIGLVLLKNRSSRVVPSGRRPTRSSLPGLFFFSFWCSCG
ncbi:hypothetical protein LZ31DRAFT_32840 [Colletotrichum somersetense]|nr:hypothetical protein LZ31DRAFT_32840 [Colletotrichum somersetense]